VTRAGSCVNPCQLDRAWPMKDEEAFNLSRIAYSYSYAYVHRITVISSSETLFTTLSMITERGAVELESVALLTLFAMAVLNGTCWSCQSLCRRQLATSFLMSFMISLIVLTLKWAC
jgi:hypothetical protein